MSMKQDELTDERRSELVRKVEDALRRIKRDDELICEWDFVRGAMAAFQAVYHEDKAAPQRVGDPRWYFNPRVGRSILDS